MITLLLILALFLAAGALETAANLASRLRHFRRRLRLQARMPRPARYRFD